MRKFTFLTLLFLASKLCAQMFMNTNCLGGVGSSQYGPMNTYTSTADSNNRTASIYTSAELAGIANKSLTSIYFKRYSGAVALAGSTPNFKVYLKETAATDFGSAALDWSTAITGATLVYDSNPTTALGSTVGYKEFVMTTPFQYSGTQNLAVFMEYSNPGASNTQMAWEYNYTSPCINTSNSNTTKFANSTGALQSSLGTSNYRRLLIGFNYSILSTNEVNLIKNDFTLNPNPAKDILNISSKSKISSAKVFDMNGKYHEVNISEKSIDVSSLIKGTYILTLQFADGTKGEKKFIKN